MQGIVLYRNGSLNKARASLLKALELDANCFPANLYLGVMGLSKDQPKEALPFLQRAQQGRPAHPIAARLLAKALLGQKKTKKAKALLKKALKADPEDSAVRLTMAELYLANKNKRMAIRTLVKAIQYDPDNQHAKQLLFRLGH
jgi:Tfp pilus assembly protein PilF